jgi:membrane protein required for colicin V production
MGALLLIGAYKGFKDGFLMSLVLLLAIIVGIFAAIKLMDISMQYLAREFNVDTKVLPYVAFAVVFAGVVLLIYLLGKAIHASIDKTFLGRVDQIAGLLLGVLRVFFMISILLWIVSAIHMELPEKWISQSKLYTFTQSFAPTLSSYFGEWLPAVGNILSTGR